MARIYVMTAERFEHSAILLHPNPSDEDEICRLVDLVRDMSGDRYCLLLHGDATYGIPAGGKMEAFSARLVEEPDAVLADAQRMVDNALARAERLKKRTNLDGFALCADYCLNKGPFLSPRQFRIFVAPFLKRLTGGYRDMGYYVIKHTDGNIMPIIEDLVDSGPHALHSLDPQAGVDIAEVKARYGKKVCLIGNVNCGKLDTGTDEECVESARYCLKHGSPGGGYIFSTSNCIYTGMRLYRYELILEEWRKFVRERAAEKTAQVNQPEPGSAVSKKMA
jgi:uroporphyrinogen decarboxylase